MARYIDADKFREKAFYADTEADINHYIRLYGYTDVVPKSEVEKIFEEIDLIHKKVFVDVAKMNLGDLEKIVLYEYFKLIGGCTNTLKKKYTESEGKNG